MRMLYECLTEEEVKKTLELVHSLKEWWEARAGKGIPFYTLGAASYIDAAERGAYYYKMKAERTNPLLLEHFSFLYEHLLAVLEKFCGKKVMFEKELALPGFHIFQYYELFKKPIASPHYDLQFDRFTWNYKNVDYGHPLSFTLALALPSGGGGLNYWDLYYNDFKELNRAEMAEVAAKSPMHYLPYEVGKIAIHEGFMLHRIAPAKEMKPGDERITLQGHGLICDDILRIYW
jgi:hypothetical protein